MEPRTPPASGRKPAGLFRRLGIGVASAELVFLVWWTGIDLGLVDRASLALPALGQTPLGSLTGLGLGMAWAAVIGLLVGLVTALSARLTGCVIRARALRRADQDPARSLVERNQSR